MSKHVPPPPPRAPDIEPVELKDALEERYLAYAGYAGRHLVKTGGQPQDALSRHDLPMLLTMGLAITAMVLIARIARRAIEAATASSAATGLLMQVDAGREPGNH